MELATELGPVFAHLFQQSIDTGEIPKEWSLANICPLFKKSDRSIIARFPRRHFCCGSLLLLVLAVRIYTLVHLFGKELFIRFSASAFRKLPSIYVFSYFPFGFEGRMWDLIVSVPDNLAYLFTLCTLQVTRTHSMFKYHGSS